ncbi:MAG TPA: S1 RNA-binding domain-containing protein, partial [Bacteroidales bacterium]|nr:S1 RNA-binding domain-containing protein [Bacteroidales bacterium]
YKGKVKSVVQFGAFIEILPGREGLLHISEIEWRRLANVEEVLHEGDEVEVKLIDFDPKTGKLKLSRKVLLPKPEGFTQEDNRGNNEHRGNRDNRDNRDNRGRRDRRDKE